MKYVSLVDSIRNIPMSLVLKHYIKGYDSCRGHEREVPRECFACNLCTYYPRIIVQRYGYIHFYTDSPQQNLSKTSCSTQSRDLNLGMRKNSSSSL